MRDGTSEPTLTMCGDVAIVTVSGELDFVRCIKLAPELNAALRSGEPAIIIDLEAVSLVDSSGIALLLNAYRNLDRTGGRSHARWQRRLDQERAQARTFDDRATTRCASATASPVARLGQ